MHRALGTWFKTLPLSGLVTIGEMAAHASTAALKVHHFSFQML